jgi:glycosyltransferase involved in cell wall biosynthesis
MDNVSFPRIHALCVAKNESDVIDQTLIAAAKWCDFIYVWDNGSTDGTWEKVLSLAQQYEQIVPFKQDDRTFDSGMRGQIFNHYRDNFQEGDWCCRLDADEFYIDDPRLFLLRVPPQYEVVGGAMFTYYFTDQDVERYEQKPELFTDDVPVEQKCRYYLNDQCEIRFFRYNQNLTWPNQEECLLRSDYKDWPTGLKGNAYPVRIMLKNFRYRSPQQIQKRLDTRRDLITSSRFPHEMRFRWQQLTTKVADDETFWSWKGRVAESSRLNYDAGDRRYVWREDLMIDTNQILINYYIKRTPITILRNQARKLKRKLVQVGILPSQWQGE